MRNILLVTHILAVGTWFGASVAQFVVTPMVRDRGGPAAVAWMQAISRMGRVLYPPAAVLILLTGIWLVLDSSVYEFENAFVGIGIVTVIVGAVLGVRIFGPRADQAAAAYEGGDNAAAASLVRSYTGFGVLDVALLAFTVTAMVYRWGA